jgi:hypothetical protein
MVDISLIPISFLSFLGFAAKEALILIGQGESLWNEKKCLYSVLMHH